MPHQNTHAAYSQKGMPMAERGAQAEAYRARLRELCAQGLLDTQIGELLGRTPQAITSMRKLLGIPSNRPRGWGNVRPERRRLKSKAEKAATSPRRCLCCGTTFGSHGPGNRICPTCKNTEAYRTSVGAL